MSRMAARDSNRSRNRWVVSQLDVQPTDRILEIGFGPGVAVGELARRATNGRIYGIDHSEVMKTVKEVDRNRVGVEADDVIWIAHDGSPRLLLSKSTGIQGDSEWYPSVFDVDVSTGKAKKIVMTR